MTNYIKKQTGCRDKE